MTHGADADDGDATNPRDERAESPTADVNGALLGMDVERELAESIVHEGFSSRIVFTVQQIAELLRRRKSIEDYAALLRSALWKKNVRRACALRACFF